MDMDDMDMDDDEDDEGLVLSKKEFVDLVKFSDSEDDEGDDDQFVGVDDMDMDFIVNDIYYKDFFVLLVKKKMGNQRKLYMFKKLFQLIEEDMERVENDVKCDFFDDLFEFFVEEDVLFDVLVGNFKFCCFVYECRWVKIVDEICKFEFELVVKWVWILFGEVIVQVCFINLLFEEDFDFEYVGKLVLVMMEDVFEFIEEFIK